jgi:hypothetical protein
MGTTRDVVKIGFTGVMCAAAACLLAWSGYVAMLEPEVGAAATANLDFSGRTDAIVPVTIHREEHVTSADGLRTKLAAMITVAVSSGGVRSLRMGPENLGGRTIEYPDRVRVVTSDKWRTKSTQQMSATTEERRRASLGCVYPERGEVVVAETQIAGVDAVEVRIRNRSTWYALDFACEIVQSVVEYEEGSVSRTTTVKLTAGEPDPSLFMIPGDYVEGPPSALDARDRAAAPCGPQCQEAQNRYYGMLDQEYYKSLKNQPQR